MSELTNTSELNDKIAKQLLFKADKMEIAGKDKFRVIAYRKASQAVRLETRNLRGVYRSSGLKGLQKIKGIGQRIAWDIVNQIQKEK